MRIALVGHSYVKRMPKLRFSRATVRKFCYGGAHASSFDQSKEFAELKKFNPELIFLQIGGNDISRYSNPEIIAENIQHLVSEFMFQETKIFVEIGRAHV